jgi:hypothetical protein
MKRSPAALVFPALVWLLAGSADARADLISWSYSWSNTPANISADAGGGFIALTNENTLQTAGNSYIVATNLQVHSSAPSDQPDTYSNKTYALGLTLTDNPSGAAGTLVFTGRLDGTASAGNANITNTFTGNTTQSVVLGDDLFTVTMTSYTPPGPPDETQTGSIGAQAVITIENIHILTLPEPGTLALAFLGVACLLGRRRLSVAARRRR